ncbi:MAG: NAD-dependent epimerase/dehydratase family protein [Aggregatilineales bacterium]
MVTALVTGGTGFVGAHVARALIEYGHHARILRRTSSPLTALEGLDVEHAIGDVTDPHSLLSAMAGCEWVFHVAAVADYWRADKDRMYRVNVEGTRYVLDAAQKAGVKRVVLTSSGAAVGLRADGQPADESVAFNQNPARFPYGHSKFLAEQEAQQAAAHGQEVVIVNPAVVIGPGDIHQISGSLIIELARRGVPALPPGSITLIDVRDVAAAHIAAAQVGKSGERYLLGAESLTWPAMARLTGQVIGVKPPRLVIPRAAIPVLARLIGGLRAIGDKVPIDATQMRLSGRDVRFDCHKAWNAFGPPQIDMRRSIRDTYDWYKAHGVLR